MANIALLESVLQAIAIQSAVGSPSVDGTDYNAFLANPLPPQIPRNESVTSENMVGDGSSRILRDIFNYYWQNQSMQISGLLNDHAAWTLMKGFLGGTASSTSLTSPAKDLTVIQQSTSVIPKLFSIYRHLQGEQFIQGDMFVNAFSITQEGEAQPQCSFDLMGTGLFADDTALTAASFDDAEIVTVPTYEYFHGAGTSFTATDGTTTYDFTAQGTLISLAIEGNNNGRIAKRPGDTFHTSTDRNSGAFARNVALGKASGHVIRVKIDLGSSLPAFKAMVQRKTLTGVTCKFVGFNKIAAGLLDYEFEVKAPKARFQMIQGDTDDAYGAISLEIAPERDPVTKGLFTARCRTDKTVI